MMTNISGYDPDTGMPQHPRCLACEAHPDVPTAFVVISATENATLTLPMPVCRSWCKHPTQLQEAVRKVVHSLMGDVEIKFAQANNEVLYVF